MKIFKDYSVYVQYEDIMLLNKLDIPIPATIYDKLIKKFNGVIIIDKHNRNDFIEYNEEHEVNFFKSLEWILDYNDYIELSTNDIKEIGTKICIERNNLAKKFMENNEEIVNSHVNVLERIKVLDLKLDNLRKILLYKMGKTNFKLPFSIEDKTEVKDTGIKRLINKFTIL